MVPWDIRFLFLAIGTLFAQGTPWGCLPAGSRRALWPYASDYNGETSASRKQTPAVPRENESGSPTIVAQLPNTDSPTAGAGMRNLTEVRFLEMTQ